MFTIKPWGCEVSGQLLGCLTPKPTAALHEIRVNQNHVYMFACECEMLCGGDERWHAEKMTVSHKSMPALIHFVCLCVCGVRQRREEDIIVTGCQSKTGRGFVLWKPTLCPLIFFSTLLFHFLLIPIIPPASWWGCGWSHKWGARGRGGSVLASFLSFLLPVYPSHLFLSVFLMRIWILVEVGCVLSTNHGLRLNSKGPLRESVWWEVGLNYIGTFRGGLSINTLKKSFSLVPFLHICVLRGKHTRIYNICFWLKSDFNTIFNLTNNKVKTGYITEINVQTPVPFLNTPRYRHTLIIAKKVLIFDPQPNSWIIPIAACLLFEL